MTNRWVIWIALVVASGCSDDGSIPQVCSSTDSAGIEVVTSFEAQWQDGQGWSLQHPPVVDIGAQDGPEEAHLFRVRDAMLWDESLVVLNGGTEDIRFFDLQGQLMNIVGRKGAGPGEFRNLSFVRVNGDSLVAWDFGNDRVSVFDKEGNLARTYRLDRPDGSDGLFGAVENLAVGVRAAGWYGKDFLVLSSYPSKGTASHIAVYR